MVLVVEPFLHTLAAPKQPGQSDPLPAILLVVIESILEVFFLCLVGFILARRGTVDATAKKTLNKLNTALFTPCLLFNKVAFSLTPSTLAELYIIPIGFVLISCFSALVAYLLGSLFKLKRGQRNFAIACATFQNSNSLPIALVQSLLSEKLPLAWGPHDTKDAMLGRALSYLVLFSTLGIIVRWSIGVRLVSSAEEGVELQGDEGERDENMRRMEDAEQASNEEPAEEDDETSSSTLRQDPDEANAWSSVKPKRSILKDPSTGSPPDAAAEAGSSSSPPSKFVLLNDPSGDASSGPDQTTLGRQPSLRKKRARIFQSFPNTPAHSAYGSRASSVHGGPDDDDDDDEEGEEAGAFKRFGRGVNRKVWRPIKKVGRKFGDFMTVPLWAALLSLVVACIPPLQHTLNQAEPLKAAIRSSGACSVPITLVTLGAYFYTPSTSDAATTSMVNGPQDEPDVDAHGRTIRKSFSSVLFNRLRSPFKSNRSTTSAQERERMRGQTRTVVVAVLARMIIVPLILVPLFGWWAYKTINRADDPVFVVVACLLIGSPTAITLAQITSASAGPAFEKLISRTLFVSYAFLTAPCTIALVLAALYIDKLQNPPIEPNL
ncbi:hypothetical protein JCM10212_005115 [Sporobolomyces blumeae]